MKVNLSLGFSCFLHLLIDGHNVEEMRSKKFEDGMRWGEVPVAAHSHTFSLQMGERWKEISSV
jgi:hypothetical protein